MKGRGVDVSPVQTGFPGFGIVIAFAALSSLVSYCSQRDISDWRSGVVRLGMGVMVSSGVYAFMSLKYGGANDYLCMLAGIFGGYFSEQILLIWQHAVKKMFGKVGSDGRRE